MMAIINYVVNREGGGETQTVCWCPHVSLQTARRDEPGDSLHPRLPVPPHLRLLLPGLEQDHAHWTPQSGRQVQRHLWVSLLLHPQSLVGARGISCLSLCLYGRRVGSMHAKILCREISDCCLCCNLFKTWYISRHFRCDVLQRELFHFSEGRKKVMHGMEKCKLLGFPARLLCNWRFIGVFSVSGDRVHISGPDKAQIGGDISLVCSSQESNPPSIIRWTVDGEEHQGTQEEVSTEQLENI